MGRLPEVDNVRALPLSPGSLYREHLKKSRLPSPSSAHTVPAKCFPFLPASSPLSSGCVVSVGYTASS